MDRRTIYTKMVIKQAFLSLLDTHKLDQITVKEICLEANINRATFYRNFKDIYDLFEAMENEMIQEAFPNGSADFDLHQLLDVIYRNQIFYREFLNNHLQSSLINSMTKDLKNSFAQILKNENVYDPQEFDIRFHFAQHGVTGLLKEWLANGCIPSPKEFSTLLLNMCHKLFNL